MTRIRNVKTWLNTPAKPNRRWIVLVSAITGGINNVTLARRLDRIEARLAALEAEPEPAKDGVIGVDVDTYGDVPEVPRRVSMLACPHGVPNFGPECPVCDTAANQ